MLIKTFTVGQIETNCYIVTDENTLQCAVIDPGDESNVILNYLEEHKLKAKYIFLTHGHFDHTMAAAAVQAETGAALCMSRKDVGKGDYRYDPGDGAVMYGEGDSFHVGGLTFQVLETPGHTPGGVCLICQDALFTGDTLFAGSCGRTDLPGGDMDALLRSLKRLYELPGDYEVYPGHMGTSTLDKERRFNYYMKYALQTV